MMPVFERIDLARRMGIVYVLEDPRLEGFGRVRYVGQTTLSLGGRVYRHVWVARRGRMKAPVCDWIRKLLVAGLYPRSRVYRTVDVEDLDLAEAQAVDLFRALYADLLNLRDGGQRMGESARWRMSLAKKAWYAAHPEARQARRESQLHFWAAHPEAKTAFDGLRFNRPVSAATREKMRQAAQRHYVQQPNPAFTTKGRRMPASQKEKLRAFWTGRKRSAETCRRIGEASRGHRVNAEARKRIGLARKALCGEATVCVDFDRTVTINGVSKTLLAWGESAWKSGGPKWRTIRDRIYVLGWDPARAIMTPCGGDRHRTARREGPMPTGPYSRPRRR